MAIPLRAMRSLDENPHPPRSSMDSETSAILSYALGKHPQTQDTDSDDPDDSPRPSSEHEDSEDFFKENDPLTSDYEPALNTRTQVSPPHLVSGRLLTWVEVATISNMFDFGFGGYVFGVDRCFDWVFIEGVFYAV